MVALLLGFAMSAQAASWTAGATVGVVGSEDVGVRPGLRLGFEPVPAAALELQGDAGVDGRWDAGLALAGRLFFGEQSRQDGEGLFLLGRFNAGISSAESSVGPWTGVSFGFGARPVRALDIEASAGPEWARAEGPRWRTELGVSVVFYEGMFKQGAGQGKVRHHPRKPPTQ